MLQKVKLRNKELQNLYSLRNRNIVRVIKIRLTEVGDFFRVHKTD